MVLANILQWYGLRNVVHTYLFPNTFDMGSHDNYPRYRLNQDFPIASRPVSPGRDVRKPLHSPGRKPATFAPTGNRPTDDIPAMSLPSGRRNSRITDPSAGSSEHPTQVPAPGNRKDKETPEITDGWFDIINDDEDSESCCSSNGIEDVHDSFGDDELPPPQNFNSFSYDFLVKGIMGFMCEFLGGGRWGSSDPRSRT